MAATTPARSKDVAGFLRIIEAYEKKYEKEWHKRARKVVDRFADERTESENRRPRFNVLWSNVETLKPFLYSATPKPVVRPRVDADDDVAETASQVLELALGFAVAEEHFGTTLRYARDDYLLAGRGTAWVRYVPDIQPLQLRDESETPSDQEKDGEAGEGQEQPQPEIVAFEETIADFVLWSDFGHTIARTWEEVDSVWRRVRMSRQALIERFGEKIGGKVPLDCAGNAEKSDGGRKEPDEDSDRAEVYEVWCKSQRRAVWLTKTYPELLDDKPDPLGLAHFFPCPRPVYATLRTDSLVPIPDYVEYQDQASELDGLTMRINALTDAIKAAGVYDQSVPALERLLQDGHDNELIPVENWAGLNEKGGLKGAIQLIPMQEIAETLILLYKAREAVKADLYEITGMSDIVRGNTNPNETYGAQRIKSSFATKRLGERQAEVERFARNLIDIMGNVIANHFSPETLARMTGVKLLPTVAAKQEIKAQIAASQQPGAPAPADLPDGLEDAIDKPTWEEVIQLLRDQPNRRFRIEIETDSMVAADDAEEQAARTEFLQTAGQFLSQAVEAGAAHPEMVPLLSRMLLFGVQGFRVGRDLYDAFEQFVKAAEEKSKQPPAQPQPTPEMARITGELELKKQAQAFDQQMQEKQFAADQACAVRDQQHRHQMEVAAAQTEAARNDQSGRIDAMQQHFDAATERMKAEFAQQTAVLVAHIQNLGKVEVARITADATADADAEQHEEQQGA